MGFLTRLFSSKKETEHPPEPTSAQLQHTLEQLATEMGEAGAAALADASHTANQMQVIVTDVSSETDVLMRYSKAIRKSSDLQVILTNLLNERTNGQKQKAAADSEGAEQATLTCAAIDVQLSLVREAKERVRLFLPADE